MATQMTYTAPADNPLGDLNKQKLAQQQRLNQAMQAYQQAAQDRAAQTPITWEQFYSAPVDVQKPQAIDYQRERRNQNIANLADAITAISQMGGAIAGGTAVPMPSLSQANQQRFMTLYNMRNNELDRYNRAVRESETRAQQMASLRQNMRDRQNKLDIEAEEARISNEQARLKQLESLYNLEYDRQLDVQNQDRADRRLAQQEYNNNRRIELQERNANDRYEKQLRAEEKKNYTPLPTVNGTTSYVRNQDMPQFYTTAFNAIQSDETLMDNAALQAALNAARFVDPTNPKATETAMQNVVNKYYASSPRAQREVAARGLIVNLDNPAPAPTPAPVDNPGTGNAVPQPVEDAVPFYARYPRAQGITEFDLTGW